MATGKKMPRQHQRQQRRSQDPQVAFMPLTYLTDALRQIMVGASSLHPLWLDFAVLGGWLVALLALATKF